MAGTFYTLQEAMQKLNKSESDIKDLVKNGKLREYRDGTKTLYKKEEIEKAVEDTIGIDIIADSEVNMELDKTAEIQLEPDNTPKKPKPESEGGFGLSQMGDLTMADTNVGTVGINVLGETDDHYKITADTKAETKSAELDEIESLDADANMENVGSGSGLLDLSLQADDTSLGAVLDDILPTGPDVPAQAQADAPIDMAKEAEGLLPEAAVQEGESAGQAGGLEPAVPASAAAFNNVPAGSQLITIAPIDPASSLYGIMMFIPLVALVMAGIATTAGLKGVLPSLLKFLSYNGIADFNWGMVISMIFLLLVVVFSLLTLTAGKTKSKGKSEVYQKKR